ncbi:hemerythrin domain-containing protein [Alkalibacter mobilis]|uniref:hemerythrin domain-containing protein n=1 Tax=Alkalibacter mobilis TaxID=2787712 RepID=UPI00189E22A0|nr:hemerythrin domain-containing protein [Alkalibacter mobilis]MBF7096174.1 hemerythrin domain-containing protein [Alkalibacter mobilis]
MNSIQLMVDEHVYAKRMLAVIRKYSYRLLKGENVDLDDFHKMIDFVRNFVDKHHHGKEEDMLFNRMVEHLGPAAEKLVKNGMLVEHDLGRLHMQELEAAIERVKNGDDESKLDIIANAVSYTHLLHRHIDKEDAVVYKFAENGLSDEIMAQINAECEIFEKEAQEKGTQEKYIKLLEELEAR